MLCTALGSKLEPEITGEFRAGDIRHCFADTTLAEELLGFRAERTLAQGLPELKEWVERQVVEERGDEAVAALRELGLVG
jgi:dTDP-L-rhamnose 4-epimerase